MKSLQIMCSNTIALDQKNQVRLTDRVKLVPSEPVSKWIRYLSSRLNMRFGKLCDQKGL